MATILDIQKALEYRIAPLQVRSRNRRGDPDGSTNRGRVKSQFWVAYTGSEFDEPLNSGGCCTTDFEEFSQAHHLKFSAYVEVVDLQRDYREALELHELLMRVIANFSPNLEGIRSAFKVLQGDLVSSRVDGDLVYRYRSDYTIWVDHELVPPDWGQDYYAEHPTDEQGHELDPTPVLPGHYAINVGLHRSPAGKIGQPPPTSTKDGEVFVAGHQFVQQESLDAD